MALVTMFKIKAILALSVAILFIPTKVLAEWVYVRPGTGGERVEIETDSVDYQSPEVFYLHRIISNALDYRGAFKTVLFSSIECSSRTGRIHRMTGFNKSGRMVFDYDKTSSPSNIMPGGAAAKLYKQLCL